MRNGERSLAVAGLIAQLNQDRPLGPLTCFLLAASPAASSSRGGIGTRG